MRTSLPTTLALLAAAVTTTVAVSGVAPAGAAEPDPFSGERRVVLAPTGSEGALGLDRSGRATYDDRWGRGAEFALTHVHGKRFQVRTAHRRSGGEPLCLAIRGVRVATEACDTSDRRQLFRFRPAGENSSGNPTYLLHTYQRRHLVQTANGAFEGQWVGEGTPDVETPFVLVDRGPAD
jgi:hypothetical protein